MARTASYTVQEPTTASTGGYCTAQKATALPPFRSSYRGNVISTRQSRGYTLCTPELRLLLLVFSAAATCHHGRSLVLLRCMASCGVVVDNKKGGETS